MPTLPKRTVTRKDKSEYKRVQDNSKLYGSRQWQIMRMAQLRKQPLCEECKRDGIVKTATDIDHIVPHKGDYKLFFSADNLQSLCHECHSRKTATEDGGWGRARARKW